MRISDWSSDVCSSDLMNPFGRIPVCGLISMYNTGPKGEGEDQLPKLMRRVLTDRLKIQGFIVSDRAADRPTAFLEEVGGYVRDGRVQYRDKIGSATCRERVCQ